MMIRRKNPALREKEEKIPSGECEGGRRLPLGHPQSCLIKKLHEKK